MEEIRVNEQDLVRQAREGDLKAFTALVELFQERAIHVAYAFVANWEDARDLAQEAFVKAYEGLGNFREESRFFTWLYRILANLSKDFLRKKKARNIFVRPGPEGADGITGRDAAAELAGQELGVEILRALDGLPFQQRSAFTFRYLEGLSLEDIAETMGLSTGAVKAHLWQAGQKMRKSLKEHAEELR